MAVTIPHEMISSSHVCETGLKNGAARDEDLRLLHLQPRLRAVQLAAIRRGEAASFWRRESRSCLFAGPGRFHFAIAGGSKLNGVRMLRHMLASHSVVVYFPSSTFTHGPSGAAAGASGNRHRVTCPRRVTVQPTCAALGSV
jgi:hypothetical protein